MVDVLGYFWMLNVITRYFGIGLGLCGFICCRLLRVSMDCIDGMKEHLSATIPRDVADMVREVMELSGWDKSRCVSEGLRIGLPELIKRMKKVMETEKKKADKPTPEDEERAREEYWRKVILGKIHSDKWVPV
jgi:hypothetical protein